MKNCVFDFALDSNFPVIDKTYNFLYFVFADKSKVKDNVIKIDVEKSYDALDAWFGGSMMTYTRAEMRLRIILLNQHRIVTLKKVELLLLRLQQCRL